ncbi:hydroxymethylglutaryl-CoA reductase [Akkermansiaceae bacterium]|nr:hydroxymethylglutaryl-CoA reductase [Akkermansiaceae bacterium]
MAGKHHLTKRHIDEVMGDRNVDELRKQLSPDLENLPKPLPVSAKTSRDRVDKLWEKIAGAPHLKSRLLDTTTDDDLAAYSGNIENLIGSVQIPIGIAGPLRVNGLFAKGDYHIPMATTEAALVASYHRGVSLITESGGCSVMLVNESLTRSPSFAFCDMATAGEFVLWAMAEIASFRKIVTTTTQHGELVDIGTTLEGNHVYLNFEFHTADASGQNMITIATQAICDYIVEKSPVTPTQAYVEANLSGDKKASARAFTTARGKKASAEVFIPKELVEKRLHCTVQDMCDYWRTSAIGGVLSGSIGIQGHFANGLTALYLATGQDVACVAESSVGVTRFEETNNHDLYASVTLPAIMVGTVGGGTGLPTQNACLELMGLVGADKSRALAEVVTGLILGGELSIIGALAAGHFTRAHKNLARRKAPG